MKKYFPLIVLVSSFAFVAGSHVSDVMAAESFYQLQMAGEYLGKSLNQLQDSIISVDQANMTLIESNHQKYMRYEKDKVRLDRLNQEYMRVEEQWLNTDFSNMEITSDVKKERLAELALRLKYYQDLEQELISEINRDEYADFSTLDIIDSTVSNEDSVRSGIGTNKSAVDVSRSTKRLEHHLKKLLRHQEQLNHRLARFNHRALNPGTDISDLIRKKAELQSKKEDYNRQLDQVKVDENVVIKEHSYDSSKLDHMDATLAALRLEYEKLKLKVRGLMLASQSKASLESKIDVRNLNDSYLKKVRENKDLRRKLGELQARLREAQ